MISSEIFALKYFFANGLHALAFLSKAAAKHWAFFGPFGHALHALALFCKHFQCSFIKNNTEVDKFYKKRHFCVISFKIVAILWSTSY